MGPAAHHVGGLYRSSSLGTLNSRAVQILGLKSLNSEFKPIYNFKIYFGAC